MSEATLPEAKRPMPEARRLKPPCLICKIYRSHQ